MLPEMKKVESDMVQHNYTELLLENSPNIIFLLDDKGKFVLCSQKLLRVTGAPDFDYIKGRGFGEVFQDISISDGETFRKISDAVESVLLTKQTAVLNGYIDFGEKGGSPRYYKMKFKAVGEKTGAENTGISSGVLATFCDKTDYIAEKERADVANRAKSDFLSTISHEIRTPMNAILGMTEILTRTSLDAQQKKYAENIKNSSNALLAIINDILDYSKIEAGKMEIKNNYYNLREMLKNLYALFLPMFKSKNLEFYFSVSKNIPDKVYGDVKRTEQILTNILSNGLKYTPEGHVEFYAWVSEDSIMHVSVHDTGIGIRPDDIKKLFRPFEQLDVRKSKRVVGTGLGLSISHKLCELMNGKLWVESTYGTGTTVFLDIPCVPEADGSVGDFEKIVEFSAKNAKVLVVDDIDINLIVAEAMLQIFEIMPDLALRGRDAVDMAEKKQYDVIFMDQMMPEMDGFETMRLIREIRPEYKNTPIIALTANVMNNAEKMFIENGFNGFLAKPIEIDVLNLCLRKFLPQGLIEFL